MKRALLSVSNKEGIVDFARVWRNWDFRYLPWGTYQTLLEAGVKLLKYQT